MMLIHTYLKQTCLLLAFIVISANVQGQSSQTWQRNQRLTKSLDSLKNSSEYRLTYIAYHGGFAKFHYPSTDTSRYKILKYLYHGVEISQEQLRNMNGVNKVNINLIDFYSTGKPGVRDCRDCKMKHQIENAVMRCMEENPQTALFDSIELIGRPVHDYYYDIIWDFADEGINITSLSLIDKHPDFIEIVDSYRSGKSKCIDNIKKRWHENKNTTTHAKMSMSVKLPKGFYCVDMDNWQVKTKTLDDGSLQLEYHTLNVAKLTFYGVLVSEDEIWMIEPAVFDAAKKNALIVLKSVKMKSPQQLADFW